MPNIFTNFLQTLSRPYSDAADALPASIRSANALYQQTLNNFFGPEGATALTITENEVLEPGVRAFYLQLAMSSSQKECYQFLDSIYAAIVAEKRGHYWDLLLAIKTINDHCNDTKVKYTTDDLNIEELPCNSIFFPKNIGSAHTDRVTPPAIKAAIQTLIRQHVSMIEVQLRVKLGQEEGNQARYMQQSQLATELDALTPNPEWRLLISSITTEQITEAGDKLLPLYKQQEKRRLEAYVAKLKQQPLLSLFGSMIAVSAVNKQDREDADWFQRQLTRGDYERYQRELAQTKVKVTSPAPGLTFI